MSDRYQELIKRDNMHSEDVERAALFHILAGNESLYDHVDDIYDFKDHSIKPDCVVKSFFTSGTRMLVLLGFNLYNNFGNHTVYDAFVFLDEKNTQLALDAIKLRFVR